MVANWFATPVSPFRFILIWKVVPWLLQRTGSPPLRTKIDLRLAALFLSIACILFFEQIPF